jgi:hypothetical protein
VSGGSEGNGCSREGRQKQINRAEVTVKECEPDSSRDRGTETIGQFDWFDGVQHGKPLSHTYAGSTDE